MKYLLINEVFGTTSTGRICAEIAEQLESNGDTVKVAFGRWSSYPQEYERFAHYFGSAFSVRFHGLCTRLFDAHGLGSINATKSLLKWADEYDPDILWLHNIHGYYINYSLLFSWIKSRPQMEVKWTLHDCWAFTGHCTYFTYAKCEKWKSRCSNCPQKKQYPASLFKDRSEENFNLKKKLFCGVKNLTLITPSNWLASLTRDSFLKEYPVKVVHNTINLSIFRPRKSDFREKYHLENKVIVLGVSNAWQDPRKGLKDFILLAEELDDKFVIVLVGLSKRQIEKLPCNIVGLEKTSNSIELAEIYSTADIFFNPTYEDNFPTVNLEAEACGTPVITYNAGGAPETINCINSHVVNPGSFQEVIRIVKGVIL